MAYSFRVSDDYQNGRQICQSNRVDEKAEIGRWIDVPAYYDNAFGPKTQIYYYTKKKFNPSSPTVLYFIGGPGVSVRDNEFDLPNMNVVFFDQRGVACSLPPTRQMFLDRQFYSSEATAHDALMILNDLKITKAAIYGHSYGTIPATIFASKYPERTLSLLLEGTIFKADKSLWIPERKIKLMQDFYDSLSAEHKNLIIKVTAERDIPKNWFSFMARTTMAVGNFKNGMSEFLNQSLFNTDIDDQKGLESFAKMMTDLVPKVDQTTLAESFMYSDVMRAMVACQELGMSQPEFSHLLNFENGQFVPDRHNIDLQSNCVPLGLNQTNANSYSAEKYPIAVSVTYFHGEHDPMTSLDQGFRHFSNSKSQQKQMLIMPEGGHVPNLEILMKYGHCRLRNSNYEFCEKDEQLLLQVQFFEKAAQGYRLSENDIHNYNLKGQNRWIVLY